MAKIQISNLATSSVNSPERSLSFKISLFTIAKHYFISLPLLPKKMVKITAELITRSPVVFNPLNDRELILRDLKIPTIRNLGVTQDQFDSIDLSNNDIQLLGNFPQQTRLKTIQLNDNRISSIEGESVATALPNLIRLILTGNELTRLEDLNEIAHIKSLEFLSLENNPVTLLKGYRAYVIARMPTLRVLDFVKISQAERDGVGFSQAVQTSSSSSSGDGLTEEEKAALKVAVTKAKTKEELEILMKALDDGKLPEGFTY